MMKALRIIIAIVLWTNLISLGQQTPVLVSPNNSIEFTKVFFNFSHQSGNIFYDIQLDTINTFSSSIKKDITGLVDNSLTVDGTQLVDSLDNLYYGTKYWMYSFSDHYSLYT